MPSAYKAVPLGESAQASTPQAAVHPRANRKAILALVLGVLGFIIPVLGVAALFLGQSVEDDIDQDPKWSNCWMATTGYYLGLIVSLGLGLALMAIVLAVITG